MSRRSDWGYEPSDWSVGIVSDFLWHDACPIPLADDDAWPEAEREWVDLEEVGTGIDRYRLFLERWVCSACGEVVQFLDRDWDPEYEDA